MLLLLCVLAAIQVFRLGGSAYAVGRETGAVVGTLLFATLLALLAWAVSRKSTLVMNIAFTCVVGMAVLGRGAMLARTLSGSPRDTKMLDAMIQQGNSMRSENLERYRRGEIADAGEVSQQAAKMLKDAASKIEDDEGKAVLSVFADMTVELGAAAKPYSDALKVFADAGGLDTATLVERQTIDDRIAMVEEMGRANESFEQAVRSLIEGARRRFAAAALSPHNQGKAEAGWVKSMRMQLRLRANQREVVDEMKATLVLLRDNFDSWGFEPGDPQVKFADDAVLTKYNAHVERIQQLGRDEEALMQELAKPMK